MNEKRRIYYRNYRKKNRERLNAYLRQYRKKNPDRARVLDMRAHARRLYDAGFIDEELRDRILRKIDADAAQAAKGKTV